MAPAFPTTLLHQASTSFRFPAGAAGCIRPHCLAPLAAPTTLSLAATPAVPRRLLLPVAAGIWDLISGGAGAAAAASLAVRRGMQLFRQGDVAGSLAEFDKAIEMDPRQKQCTSSYLLLLINLPAFLHTLHLCLQQLTPCFRSLATGPLAVLPRQVCKKTKLKIIQVGGRAL
jgi:hypothetical protein